ncbi:BspA family leucine-rich repeat surface protein [Succinimonas amylolytica]|uniref:BspA family leucine-rich repeat surface protein n=1 Tax=Succinimonas amylolytica TaxID=83769 RepID=UPI0023A8098A
MACMYKPANKDELHELVANPEICLGDIDTSLITDMSELFEGGYNREDFSGIENWDTSRVTDMSKMFYRGKNFTYVIRK